MNEDLRLERSLTHGNKRKKKQKCNSSNTERNERGHESIKIKQVLNNENEEVIEVLNYHRDENNTFA